MKFSMIKGNCHLIFILIFSVFASVVNAQQNDKIGEIRRIYQGTNDQIAEAEKNFAESEIFLSEMIVNKGGTMYPAVGNFSEEIKFYYTYGDREKNPYPNRLLKIIVSTERSARSEFSEYVFNSAGQLIFYFGKDEETENRLYFAAGKLIRRQTGEKIIGVNSRESQENVKNILNRKDKLTQIFRNLLE